MSQSKEIIQLEELISNHISEVKGFLTTNNHPSIFEDYEYFQVLIVRRMIISEKSLSFVSEIFLIKEDLAYRYKSEEGGFTQLKNGNRSMYKIIESMYLKNLKIMDIYVNEVERLEEYLFNRNPPAYFMDLWFDLKKALAKAENYYFRSSTVFKEFLKKSQDFIGDYSDEYVDIDDMLKFQTTNLTTLQARLESLHNYFVSIKNDKLNATLLLLTLISGVFLPLNLIVGFFGMNTQGLFFTEDPNGTLKVILILASVLVFCLVGLKIIRMINDYILRFFLGKNKLYKRISKRIDNLDQQLKGK